MSINFTKAQSTRIFRNVVEQIESAIINGSIQPGEILPGEVKLSETFETSRGTIREALRVLEQKGLIEIKTGAGGGSIVKELEPKKIAEIFNFWLQYKKVSLDHLIEFREMVEGPVIALAAERAKKRDIQYLKQLLEQAFKLLEAKDVSWKDFINLDIKLHISIAEITGNPIYSAILHMVHENLLGYYDKFSIKKKKALKENYQDLCGIVQAIENHESIKAQSLARHHVRKFGGYIKRIK